MIIAKSAFIHPLAVVTDAEVGSDTRIWQFASVIRGAKIGDRCNVASGACIDGSEVGDDCVIGHNLAMGPGFRVGNRVFIGPNCTFCNDAWPRAGKEWFDVAAYKSAPAIIVEDGASIGSNSVILAGVRIGAGAMIAAGSVVGKDVPAGALWKKGEPLFSPYSGEAQEASALSRRIRHAR